MIESEVLWTYKGKIITEISDMPDGTFGFVYEVTHISTGKKYLGKKVLFFERNKRLGKRALEALRLERKEKGMRGRAPLKTKVITESDWKTYCGSQKEIVELVKNGKKQDFTKEILEFVKSKKLLTYFECKHLFIREVLENRDNYLNDNILGKFFRKDFYTKLK